MTVEETTLAWISNLETGEQRWDSPMTPASSHVRLSLCPDEGGPLFCGYQYLAEHRAAIALHRDEWCLSSESTCLLQLSLGITNPAWQSQAACLLRPCDLVLGYCEAPLVEHFKPIYPQPCSRRNAIPGMVLLSGWLFRAGNLHGRPRAWVRLSARLARAIWKQCPGFSANLSRNHASINSPRLLFQTQAEPNDVLMQLFAHEILKEPPSPSNTCEEKTYCDSVTQE